MKTLIDRIYRILGLSKRCERCGARENLERHDILGLFGIRLCDRCKRDWEAHIMGDPDYQLWRAICRYGQEIGVSEDERLEVTRLTEDVAKELKGILEKWICSPSR